MQAVYLSSSPGGARVTRLWEPVGSPCCPRNPSSDATEAADRSTPDPRGGHERGTLRWQRSTAGCPRHKAFKLPSQAAGRGDAHTFASVPWKVRARALLFQDTYASPPPPTGNECESTPSSRGISPASQTGAGEDPTTPHHPGLAAAEDAFAQEQSHGFYDVQTANRKSKRGGQRTGPLPQGACRNHSRILDVNKAHSSSIQVCSQHLWLVSCDRARRLSVILGFWAPNDQGLRAATGHPLLLGEHTED